MLAENDGLRVPNPYGDVPFKNFDPTKPNEKYFEHVDYIVNKANELGLVVGMLPTWGDKVFSEHPAAGPIVFNEKNAEVFGEFLGKRYRNADLVWILGGDRNIANLEVLNLWRGMAKGLRKGDDGNHLITYHPRGGTSSSYWLHNEKWLDFNFFQSGHGQHYNTVYEFAETDRLKRPVKPTIDGEPAYEDIAVKFWDYCDWSLPKRAPDSVMDDDFLIKDKSYFKEGFFTDYDVRIHAYWNFLSGACGYTYGNNAVWQMFKKGGPIAIPCLYDWKESLQRPGANDIRHIRKLFQARSIGALVPDQSIVYGMNPKNEDYIVSASVMEGQSLLIYLAKGQPVDVVMKKIAGKKSTAKWFDPRTGEVTEIGEVKNDGIQKFTPPSSGKDNDWVLVLDSKSAKLPKW